MGKEMEYKLHIPDEKTLAAILADAKIAALRRMIDATGRKIRLEVDGGVAVGTARQVKAAGADVLVAGSSVFGARGGFASAIEAIRADA